MIYDTYAMISYFSRGFATVPAPEAGIFPYKIDGLFFIFIGTNTQPFMMYAESVGRKNLTYKFAAMFSDS